jgi:hypothetical protein
VVLGRRPWFARFSVTGQVEGAEALLHSALRCKMRVSFCSKLKRMIRLRVIYRTGSRMRFINWQYHDAIAIGSPT